MGQQVLPALSAEVRLDTGGLTKDAAAIIAQQERIASSGVAAAEKVDAAMKRASDPAAMVAGAKQTIAAMQQAGNAGAAAMAKIADGVRDAAAAGVDLPQVARAASAAYAETGVVATATQRAVEKSGEAMIRQLEREAAAIGQTSDQRRDARVEAIALAAAELKLTDVADRLLAASRQRDAAARAAAEDSAAAAAQAEQDARTQQRALEMAAAGHQAFEAAARAGMAAMQEEEAAALRLATAAARLRDVLDPVGAAEARLAAELSSIDQMFSAGLLNLDQYVAAEERARAQLDATTAALERQTVAARDSAAVPMRSVNVSMAGTGSYIGAGSAQASAEAMQELLAEQERLAASANRLRASIDPAFASQQRFDREMGEARTLIAAGAISLDDYCAKLRVETAALEAAEGAAEGVASGHGRMSASGMEMMHVVRASSDAFAAGIPPLQIFSMEIGRVAQAASTAGGGTGALGAIGAFLSGPWGIALTVGVAVLGPLVAKLWENEEAAKAAEKAMTAFANYEDNIGSFIDKTTGKLIAQNSALIQNAQLLRKKAGDDAAKASVDAGQQAFSAARNAASVTVTTSNTAGTSQTYTDPKIQAALDASKGSAVILAQNLAALAATDSRYKSLSATVSDYAAKAAFANKTMHEQRGEATELADAIRNGGVQTIAGVNAQVQLATASDGVARARAQLSQVQAEGDRIEKMVYGPAKLAAIAQYKTELTAANNAVTAAEAAKKAASAASRAAASQAKHDATLARSADAVEAQIINTNALADAYRASGAEALIAEARVKAESAAIKSQGDVEAAVSRQVQLVIAQRVAEGERSAASMRDQARIQADVNGMVAAGNVPAEQAAQLVQQRIAELPLLQALEAAQQRGLKDGIDKATQALQDQRDAQEALKAASYGKQSVNDDAAAARELATLRQEATLIGATDEARTHAMATLKAQQEAQDRYGSSTNAYALAYIANQVKIADETLANKKATDAYNASLSETADHWDIIAGKVQSAAEGMADAFGSAGKAIGDVASTYASYMASQSKLEEEHNRAITAAGKNQQLIAQENARFALQSSGAQVAAYGDMLGAAKGFFKEGSAGYQALAAAEKVYRVAQFAMSIQAMVQQVRETVTHVASSAARTSANATEAMSAQAKLTWPLNLIAMAATAAALLAAGIAVFGGGGGSSSSAPTSSADLQKATGTGTVLGSASDKSASIAHSLDLVAKNTADDLGVSNAMLVSLKTINTSIVAMAATVGKEIAVSGSIGDTSALNLGSSGSGGFLGLFSSSTTRSLYDAGITLAATTVGNIVANGISGQTYQIVEQVKKSSGFLGIGGGTKTTYQTSTGALPSDISASIQSVIGALENGIVAAAGEMGNSGAKAMLDNFTVDIGKLSFNGLDAQGISDQLNAVFSSVGDKMVEAIMPGIERFQQAGEGLFETLERVASTVVAVDAEMSKLGVSATGLGVDIDMGIASKFDSVSDFTSAADAYFKTYYSTAEQTAAAAGEMQKEFASLNLTMPTSLAGFRQLVEAQDLTTSAGQSTYATLLQLAPAFATLQESLAGAKSAADIASEAADLQKQIWQATGDTASIRAAELAALDASNRPLQQRLYDLQDEAAATAAANTVAQERKGIETTLLQLQGDTVTQRQNELAALDPANRALQEQVYALQDQQAAATAAAQAAEAETQRLAAVASERLGLENQLLQLQGDVAGQRERELATLDPTNRAIQQQIYALTDLQAAQQAAAQAEEAIAQERAGIQQQLWQLQGDTTSIRAAELAGLNESNRALMEQVYALTDQQAATQAATQAAQEAAQAEAAIAQERAGLMNQLWQLTGDTASIRAAALAALDPSNRALQEEIWAVQDAQDAAKAASDLSTAWKSVGDTITDEVNRIRGLTDAQSATGGFVALQGQFNAAIAAANAGDQDAAKNLPTLSKSLLDAAATSATSSQELTRIQAETAAMLESVTSRIASATGASDAATDGLTGASGATLDSETWWSQFAGGADAPARIAANDTSTSSELQAVRDEMAALRKEQSDQMGDLLSVLAAIAGTNRKTAETLDRALSQGNGEGLAVVTQAAA